jgi:4-amino-4-deoxy-L-arabinose transferase-like glycosyltransferase
MLLALPTLFVITLPASVLATILIVPRFRATLDASQRESWRFLMAWLIPTTIFLSIAPAKASRYWVPVFGAVALMGAMAWHQLAMRQFPSAARRAADVGLTIIMAGTGAGGMLLASAGFILAVGWYELAGVDPVPAGIAAIASGVAMLAVAGWGWWQRRGGHVARLATAVVVMTICTKPADALLFRPARSAELSMRASARRLDEIIPPGRTVFVLSDKPGVTRSGEQAELGYYAEHTLIWPPDVDEAIARGDGPERYLVMEPKGYERLKQRFGPRLELVEKLENTRNREIFVLRLTNPEENQMPSTRESGDSGGGP